MHPDLLSLQHQSFSGEELKRPLCEHLNVGAGLKSLSTGAGLGLLGLTLPSESRSVLLLFSRAQQPQPG